jgi:hypothetical protein
VGSGKVSVHSAACANSGKIAISNPTEARLHADTVKEELEDMKAAVDFAHYKES